MLGRWLGCDRSLPGFRPRGLRTRSPTAEVLERGSPQLLALFDLDGFKDYNDTHGHPEGDALLRRLATRMAGAVRGDGRVYRLGGDEFCVVTLPGPLGRAVIARASDALHERGPGWAVGASCGVVELGVEAGGVSEAMGIADRRMYAQKARRPAAARRQAGDVLLSALGEQQPGLHGHVEDVAALVGHVAVALGMEPDVDDVVRAAELHDVGKLAIPREILDMPGPRTRRSGRSCAGIRSSASGC